MSDLIRFPRYPLVYREEYIRGEWVVLANAVRTTTEDGNLTDSVNENRKYSGKRKESYGIRQEMQRKIQR